MKPKRFTLNVSCMSELNTSHDIISPNQNMSMDDTTEQDLLETKALGNVKILFIVLFMVLYNL